MTMTMMMMMMMMINDNDDDNNNNNNKKYIFFMHGPKAELILSSHSQVGYMQNTLCSLIMNQLTCDNLFFSHLPHFPHFPHCIIYLTFTYVPPT